jgi:hypothetical protein
MPTVRRYLLVAAMAGLGVGCAGPAPVHTEVQHPAVHRHQDPFAQFAPLTKRLVDEHKAGQPTILARSDAEKFIRAFMIATKLLPPGPSRVECPAELDLTGSKHGRCALHVSGVSIPCELWIDDRSRQIRARGDGQAIETTHISDAVAKGLQQKLTGMDISPYDVQCGDNQVIVVRVGSHITCEFTADGRLFLLGVKFVSLKGQLLVTVLR